MFYMKSHLNPLMHNKITHEGKVQDNYIFAFFYERTIIYFNTQLK